MVRGRAPVPRGPARRQLGSGGQTVAAWRPQGGWSRGMPGQSPCARQGRTVWGETFGGRRCRSGRPRLLLVLRQFIRNDNRPLSVHLRPIGCLRLQFHASPPANRPDLRAAGRRPSARVRSGRHALLRDADRCGGLEPPARPRRSRAWRGRAPAFTGDRRCGFRRCRLASRPRNVQRVRDMLQRGRLAFARDRRVRSCTARRALPRSLHARFRPRPRGARTAATPDPRLNPRLAWRVVRTRARSSSAAPIRSARSSCPYTGCHSS